MHVKALKPGHLSKMKVKQFWFQQVVHIKSAIWRCVWSTGFFLEDLHCLGWNCGRFFLLIHACHWTIQLPEDHWQCLFCLYSIMLSLLASSDHRCSWSFFFSLLSDAVLYPCGTWVCFSRELAGVYAVDKWIPLPSTISPCKWRQIGGGMNFAFTCNKSTPPPSHVECTHSCLEAWFWHV